MGGGGNSHIHVSMIFVLCRDVNPNFGETVRSLYCLNDDSQCTFFILSGFFSERAAVPLLQALQRRVLQPTKLNVASTYSLFRCFQEEGWFPAPHKLGVWQACCFCRPPVPYNATWLKNALTRCTTWLYKLPTCRCPRYFGTPTFGGVSPSCKTVSDRRCCAPNGQRSKGACL